LAFVGFVVAACTTSDDVNVPVKPAPASRHDQLRTQLRTDAHGFAFSDGAWANDEHDAVDFGLGWLSHQHDLDTDEASRRDAAKARALSLLSGPPQSLETLHAALGLVEYASATGDKSVLPALDRYLQGLDASGDFAAGDGEFNVGPTELTALMARVHTESTLALGEQRTARASALDGAIRAQAFGDLVDPTTHAQARAYEYAPDSSTISDTANIAMLILKARLFRLTKDPVFQIEARAIYAALQPLKLTPGRYASPDEQVALKSDAHDVTLLSAQINLALGLTLLFEITGEDRFIQEADQAFDAIAAMHGPTGLAHHAVGGALDPQVCAGCTFRALSTLGYRRALAGEPF
jgi:hypothetical protein